MNRRLSSLTERLQEIEKELSSLESFRPTTQMQRFKRQLFGEYSYVKKQISNAQADAQAKSQLRDEKAALANQNRSEKMKRTWRYLRSIQQNYFPEKGLRELRSLLKKQKEGQETDVPDVVWRNPSP
jgi:hypothetical protein